MKYRLFRWTYWAALIALYSGFAYLIAHSTHALLWAPLDRVSKIVFLFFEAVMVGTLAQGILTHLPRFGRTPPALSTIYRTGPRDTRTPKPWQAIRVSLDFGAESFDHLQCMAKEMTGGSPAKVVNRALWSLEFLIDRFKEGKGLTLSQTELAGLCGMTDERPKYARLELVRTERISPLDTELN